MKPLAQVYPPGKLTGGCSPPRHEYVVKVSAKLRLVLNVRGDQPAAREAGGTPSFPIRANTHSFGSTNAPAKWAGG
eukprot:5883560-Pyramimonas_sp.AAC.1